MTPEKDYCLLNTWSVRIAATDLIYSLEKVSNPKPTTHATMCYCLRSPSPLI